MTLLHHADPTDDDEIVREIPEAQPGEDDHQYAPRVGQAADPYADDPQARALALAPLFDSDEARTLWTVGGDGAARLELLLDQPDPAAVVQALPPQDFAWLVRDVGENDAPELLALASPRQLQAVVDFSAWRGPGLHGDAVLTWLAVAEAAGLEVAERFVVAQEDGVLCLALLEHLRAIPDHAEVEAELPDDGEVFLSPDGAFRLIADPADPLLPAARRLVDLLFAHDLLRARAVTKGLYWELPAQLADDVEQSWTARMEELGLHSPVEARAIYAYRDPLAWQRSLERNVAEGALPLPDTAAPAAAVGQFGLAVASARQPPLFAQAMARLTAAEAARVATAAQVLAYRAHAANAASIGHIEELPRWSRHALTTVALALHHGCGGDVGVAADLLRAWPLADLFAVGHSLVVIQVHRARRLRTALGGEAGVALLAADDATFLRNLLGRLPLVQDGPTWRPVETPADLAALAQRLADLEALQQILAPTGAGWRLDALPKGASLQMLLATALAWRALGQPPSQQPLDAAAVRALVGTAFARGRWRADVRLALAAGPEALRPAVTAALDALEAELGSLDAAGAIDLRFIGDVVLLAR